MSDAVYQSPGTCKCQPCNVTFHATGCNGLDLAGATVTVWTDATKTTLIATGTTNASGNFTADVGSPGSKYWEVSRSRFTTASQTVYVYCGGTYTQSVSPDTASYQCYFTCAVPISKTLHLTDSVVGSITLNWVTTDWQGSVSYVFPGCASCPPGTITVSYRLDQNGNLFVTAPLGAPCSTDNSQFLLGSSVSCPTPFSVSKTGTGTRGLLYCGANPTLTLTE